MFSAIFRPFVAILDFITKYFKTFVFLFIVLLIVINSTETTTPPPNLAKIYIKGMILDSSSLRAQIEEIKKHSTIKGVLLVIDSPGGAIGASVEMADLIKGLNAHIPVVAHAEGVMASGSYYVGAYAEKIYANRGSLVGSIGVIFNGVNIQDLMHKIGIQSQTLAAGEYKEAGTYYRAWSQKEKQYLKQILDEEYKMFIQDIAQARNLKVANANVFAEGKIFNAFTAQKIGLIDTIGSRDEAINELKVLAGVTKEKWLEKNKIESYLDKILQSSTNIILSKLAINMQ